MLIQMLLCRMTKEHLTEGSICQGIDFLVPCSRGIKNSVYDLNLTPIARHSIAIRAFMRFNIGTI